MVEVGKEEKKKKTSRKGKDRRWLTRRLLAG